VESGRRWGRNIGPTVFGKENGLAFKGIGGILVAVSVTIKPGSGTLGKVVVSLRNIVVLRSQFFSGLRNSAVILRRFIFRVRMVVRRRESWIKHLGCEWAITRAPERAATDRFTFRPLQFQRLRRVCNEGQ
jgi:hypothetical protein